jgi:hypothetical protein
MLPILCAMIVFLFLMLGATVFVFCSMVPRLRKFALSAALWCAVWGPCTVAWMLVGGVALFADGLAMSAAESRHVHLPSQPNAIPVSYLVLGILGTLIVATLSARLHQMIIHRMTFALFRIYTGLVSASIGSVWGWCLGLILVNDPDIPIRLPVWGLGMMTLCTLFGYAGFRWAKLLRGDAPTLWALVSREEFDGTF